jgi:outer membrane protein OmpA-like peptidoglycan-associated protein
MRHKSQEKREIQVLCSFEQYLLLLVDQINQNKEIEIEINGHTDNKGKEEYNQALSLKRANAIKLFLVSNGVTNHIDTSGFGDSQPTFPNITDENRSKNRRVEIFFKPTMNN